MAANPGGSASQITYEIIFQAQDAIEKLQQMDAAGASFDEMAAAMQARVDEVAKAMGVDWTLVLNIMKMLNNELAKTGDGVVVAMDKSKSAIDAAKTSSNQMFNDVKQGLQESAAEGTSFVNVANMIKMALGEIEAIVVFQLFTAITNMFSEAVKDANDYYQALQNITIAQNAMAQHGVATTNQELLDMATQLHDKFQTFAQIDMVNAVSQAALLSQQYGLSVQQVQRLVEMASTLAREHGGMPADYVDNLLKASQATNALWANQMGINITQDEILAKAKDLGMVSQDFTGKLTDQQKVVAGMALEWDRLSGEESKALSENNTVLAQQQAAAAKWKDALTQVGTAIDPALAKFKEMGAVVLVGILHAMETLQGISIQYWSAMYAGAITVNEALRGNIRSLQEFSDTYSSALKMIEEGMRGAFGPGNTGGINLGQNTPAGPAITPEQVAPLPDPTKVNSILDSVAKAYMSYYDSVQKATEQFNNRMQDLQDEYNLRVQQEEQNTALRMSEEKQNYHLRVMQEEENFQQKMRDLTSRYQMDLEDALRKRDAEAVIKIIERYNNEKETAKQQETLKLQQMKQEEQLRLKQMKEEEQLRLKQMAQEFQLQQAQATRNYNQQLADLKASLDQKLQEEAVSAGQELGLNQDGINKLYDLFKEYYGSDGKFAQTQQASYTQMVNQSAAFVQQMMNIFSGYASALSSAMGSFGTIGEGSNSGGYGAPKSNTGGGGGGGGLRKATGGYALAQSATTVTFGERPELAMFIPLNSSRDAVGSSMGGLNGLIGQGAGGLARIAVELGPDLVGRIVNTTLTHAAISIEHIYGSK